MNHTSGNDKTGLEEVLEKLVGADMLGTSVYQDVKAEHDKRLSEKRINMVATESETPPQPSEPSNLSSRTIEGLNIPQYCRDIRAAKDMYMVVAIGTHLEARICDLITQARKDFAAELKDKFRGKTIPYKTDGEREIVEQAY